MIPSSALPHPLLLFSCLRSTLFRNGAVCDSSTTNTDTGIQSPTDVGHANQSAAGQRISLRTSSTANHLSASFPSSSLLFPTPSSSPDTGGYVSPTTGAWDCVGHPYPSKLFILTDPWKYPCRFDFVSVASRYRLGISLLPAFHEYSIGLYIESSYLSSYMETQSDTPDPELLFDPQVNKTLRFVATGRTDSSRFSKSIAGSLRSALPLQESAIYCYTSGSLAIEDLRMLLLNTPITEGSVITVTLLGNPEPGKIVLMYAENSETPLRHLGVMENIGLCFAFHNLFLIHPLSQTAPRLPAISSQFITDGYKLGKTKTAISSDRLGHADRGCPGSPRL